MVTERDFRSQHHHRVVRYLQNSLANLSMRADEGELLRRERGRFLEQIDRNGQLSNVVQDRGLRKTVSIVGRDSQSQSHTPNYASNPPGVTVGAEIPASLGA
jgi:hypothetical protein